MIKTKEYVKTHIGTYRYKCLKIGNGFPVSRKGNYESLLSFKELPPYKELEKTGRKWIYTKNYYPVMDRIILDVDCPGGLDKAFTVTKSIMQDLGSYSDCINVYFSGSKGFHIEILTAELDIIDTSVNKPMNSCYQYVNFLNYFMDKYPEVDLSLKDVGTRIIRKPHTKHEKSGNFKILIDINASLDDILEHSSKNIDMTVPKNAMLSKDQALKLLNTYSKEVDNSKLPPVEVEKVDISIFTTVYDELNTNIHNKILLIASGLNGYLDKSEMLKIYENLTKTTDIEDSDNAKGSFIGAYENDKYPCNLGALRNHYINKKIDLTNFNKLSSYLEMKLQTNAYDRFNKLLADYNNNWFDMLELELYDYVDNTENVFVGVINGLMALFGYGSRNIVVNGGAEVGKSEYINTIKKLMPRFENLGSSTPASVRRQSEYAFDRKIIYLGDKGLKGNSQNSKEEFEGLQEVFGGLITEKEFKRDIVQGDKVLEFNLKSDGVCVFYSEPYTNLRIFGAGDQYTTRSTFITVNPVEDGLSVFLQDDKTNDFYKVHYNYIKYILKNPIKLDISNEVKTRLYNASEGSLRTAKYLLALFKSYCQYLRIGNPSILDVEDFLKVFKVQMEITDIEFMIYKKLYQNLNALREHELSLKLDNDGSVYESKDILRQSKDRKEKSFFTAKQIKTYFKQDFKRNKNLKDTIDQIPSILNNLYNANYLNKIEWQYNNQNLYYLPYNEDMEI